jgi:hypothetical protein
MAQNTIICNKSSMGRVGQQALRLVIIHRILAPFLEKITNVSSDTMQPTPQRGVFSFNLSAGQVISRLQCKKKVRYPLHKSILLYHNLSQLNSAHTFISNFPNKPISCMEKSPFWESKNRSASQEILHLLWKEKVHYRFHKSLILESSARLHIRLP